MSTTPTNSTVTNNALINSTLHVVVVDDERLARNSLKRRLEEFADVEVVGEGHNADDAAKKIVALQPDLLFLDVQMPGASGFDLLERLETSPIVIFTTAHDDYAVQAFEANALDYLVKPIEQHRLAAALEKARAALRQRSTASTNERAAFESTLENTLPSYLDSNEHVFVRDGDRCWFVKLRDIRLFESEGNYTRLHFASHKPMIFRSLAYLEERLHPDQFFRASRQHIVNLAFVQTIEPRANGGLAMSIEGSGVIAVSRRQAQKLKELKSL